MSSAHHTCPIDLLCGAMASSDVDAFTTFAALVSEIRQSNTGEPSEIVV